MGAAAVAIGVESVKAAADFQASMEKIHTQAGAAQKDVASLTRQVLKMAPSAQQGPQALSEALFHLKSLGMDNVAAMKALRQASDLAAVGGANLEETATAIGAAWRSGIKGGKSFSQVAGTVNAVIGAGNLKMEDLINALGTGILPSARTFGVSLKSVGAALALMTDEGIPAQNAATRLRMSLSLLGAPSHHAADVLSDIGLKSDTLAKAMRQPSGLLNAIEVLKQHLDDSGLSAVHQAQLLSEAFGGGRSSSAILTMINNLSVLQQKQQQINGTTGRYGAAVMAQRKTAQAQFDLLRSSIDTIGVRIGLALLPPVTRFARFLATVVVPGAVKAGGVIGHAFESIIPVKAIENDWNKLLAFLGLRKPTPPKLTTADLIHAPKPLPLTHADLIHMPKEMPSVPLSVDLLHRSPQGGIFDPRQAGKAAASTAATLSAAFRRIKWGNIISSAISGAVSSAGRIGAGMLALMSKIDWAGVGRKAAFTAVPFIIGFVNNLASALISEAIHHPMDMVMFIASLIPIGRVAGIVGKLFGEIPILGKLIGAFAGPLEKAGSLVEGLFGKLFGKLAGWLSAGVSKLVTRAFGGLPERMVIKGGDMLLGFLVGIERRFPKVANWLLGLGPRILGFLKSAGIWLVLPGISVVNGMLHGITGTWHRVSSWLGGVQGRVLLAFGGAAGWLLHAGGSIIAGLLHGIQAKIAGIGGWIKTVVVDPIINAVKGWFGIRSPSTVMHGIGANLILGLIRGIMHHNPLDVVRKVFGGLPSALGHLVEKGLVSIASLPGKALRALGGLGGKIGHFFGNLFGGGGGTAGTAQWSGLASRVLAMLGQPASALGIVLSQMATESGGNPKAVNLWDSNAAAGTPSKGLMQVIQPTFDAYAGPFRGLGIWNPMANIYAGLNYAIHRYGARGWMGVLGHGHGYWTGTRAARPGWAKVGERGEEWVNFAGGEQVLPHGQQPPTLRQGPLIHADQLVVNNGTDLALLGQKLNFATISSGFRM